MKKTIVAVLVLALLCCGVAVADYTVNGNKLTDMSVEELYDLEDEIVSALTDVFAQVSSEGPDGELIGLYVINTGTDKFHYPFCYSALQIGKNREFVYAAASELVEQGYKPCGMCKPFVIEE